jgi:hypothetical protein
MSIEQYYENLEKAEQEKLRKERLLELEKYDVDGSGLPLGEMESAIWENFLLGAKSSFEERQRAEKEEAEKFAEDLRIDALYNERRKSILDLWQFIPDENKDDDFGTWEETFWNDFVADLHELENKQNNYDGRLKALLIYGDYYDSSKLTIDSTENDFEQILMNAKTGRTAYSKEQEKIKAENEKLRADNEKAETKRIADKKRSDNKLQKEREEKQKLEDQIAEDKRIREEEAEALKNAPDREMLENLIIQISHCRDQIKNTGVRNYLYIIITDMETYAGKL